MTRASGAKKTAMQPGWPELLVGAVVGAAVGATAGALPVLPAGPEEVAVSLGLGLGEELGVTVPDGAETEETWDE